VRGCSCVAALPALWASTAGAHVRGPEDVAVFVGQALPLEIDGLAEDRLADAAAEQNGLPDLALGRLSDHRWRRGPRLGYFARVALWDLDKKSR